MENRNLKVNDIYYSAIFNEIRTKREYELNKPLNNDNFPATISKFRYKTELIGPIPL